MDTEGRVNNKIENDVYKGNEIETDSNCTLEKIALVLDGVKKHLKNYNLSQDSYSDIVPTLENKIKDCMVKYEENVAFEEEENDGVEMYVKVSDPPQKAAKPQSHKTQQGAGKSNNSIQKPNQTFNKKSINAKLSGKNGNKKNNVINNTKVIIKNSKQRILESNIRKTNRLIKENCANKSPALSKTSIRDSRRDSSCSSKKRTGNSSSSSASGGSFAKLKTICENLVALDRKNRKNSASPTGTGKTTSSLLRNYSNASGISKYNRPRSTTNFLSKRLSVSPGNIDRNVYNPLARYKEEVDAAIKARKTFVVRGTFMAVRRALLRRGWVEKIGTAIRHLITDDLRTFAHKPIVELLDLIRQKHKSAELCKRLIRSKLLINHQVDLYWSYNYSGFKECSDKNKLTLINKIRWFSSPYTSKQALSAACKKAIWFHIPGVASLNHPRSYRLVNGGDAEEFVKDFNLTAAMSLLKWVRTTNDTQQCRIMSSSGKVPLKFFDFAINECYKFIKRAMHQDIDHEIKDALSSEWNEFLEYFYKIVHVGNHFNQENDVTELDLVRRASFILEKLKDHCPYLEMDGLMNIWILKPTNSCRGLGIHMCKSLNYVLDTVKANPHRRYIIQKYIERPMLIYNTKFDIRQWFLISSCCPLTIWIYRQCYLRFSSQTYNLRKLHESIHLTNNSVQCKYRNQTKDLNLPSFNMWDSMQFKNYLSDIGYPNVYNEVVFPGMRECIVAAVLTHYENMDTRTNTFELYGADFILTEDFKPWLLEINANPALYASTPITARLCPRVLEDVIKVVVDHARDKTASTGGFELVYKGIDDKYKQKELAVDGKNIKILECDELDSIKNKESNIVRKVLSTNNPQNCSELGLGMKKTLEGLLELIQKERERREEKLLNRAGISEKLDSEIQTQDGLDTSITSTSDYLIEL